MHHNYVCAILEVGRRVRPPAFARGTRHLSKIIPAKVHCLLKRTLCVCSCTRSFVPASIMPHLMSAPALRASMKALVPDLAMVPRLFTRSALVMPTPVSSIVRVLFACGGVEAERSSRISDECGGWKQIRSTWWCEHDNAACANQLEKGSPIHIQDSRQVCVCVQSIWNRQPKLAKNTRFVTTRTRCCCHSSSSESVAAAYCSEHRATLSTTAAVI